MKKILYPVLLLLLTSVTTSFAEKEPQNIPIAKLGDQYQLIGKLHIPLGKVVTIEGVVVEGLDRYEDGPNLRVQRIQGRATQEDIQIPIKPFFYDWGEKPTRPKLEMGATYEMEGYETGGFVGVPAEAFNGGTPVIQTTNHYFCEVFYVTKAKRIDPIAFAPGMFNGERAIIQGKAESKDGKAYMVGDRWRVVVLPDKAWPKHVEGKQVETYGMYSPDSDRKVFRLVDGKWHLVKLEDQVGREVELRGMAQCIDDLWWFHYRGIDLYVENMQNLPGWSSDNHWRPVIICGRLEKATLPRLDQIMVKSDRDMKEHYIVRNAGWTPLSSLLSLERPYPKAPKKLVKQTKATSKQ